MTTNAHEVTMGRVVGRIGRWKWLRPGMGVKRWLVLLTVGLVLLIFAVTGLSRIDAIWAFLQRLHPVNINPLIEVFLLAAVGSGGVAIAVLIHGATTPASWPRR